MKNSIILSLCFLALLSCGKKKDTIVEITVKNEGNQVVAGANVKLLTLPPYEANSTPVLEMEGSTDLNGVVRFNFNDVFQLGQAGVAVLNIEVEKGDLTDRGSSKWNKKWFQKSSFLSINLRSILNCTHVRSDSWRALLKIPPKTIERPIYADVETFSDTNL